MKILSLYDGKYEVSDSGEVFSNRGKRKRLVGKVTKGGYRMLLFYDNDGCRIYKNAHRVVAEAFIPNPQGLREVNHKDGNKLNNAVENLEWVTTQTNVVHCRDKVGNKACKITLDDANKIKEMIASGAKYKEIQQKYGIGKTEIGYIKNGKRWGVTYNG